jgi:hypothetical protein
MMGYTLFSKSEFLFNEASKMLDFTNLLLTGEHLKDYHSNFTVEQQIVSLSYDLQQIYSKMKEIDCDKHDLQLIQDAITALNDTANFQYKQPRIDKQEKHKRCDIL